MNTNTEAARWRKEFRGQAKGIVGLLVRDKRALDGKVFVPMHEWLVDDILAAASAQSTYATSCPCLYVEPCDPRCTCVNVYSSTGCKRCCRYGSLEQRTANAERLATYATRLAELEACVDPPGQLNVDLLIDWKSSHFTLEESRLTYLAAEEQFKIRLADLQARLAEAEGKLNWAEQRIKTKDEWIVYSTDQVLAAQTRLAGLEAALRSTLIEIVGDDQREYCPHCDATQVKTPEFEAVTARNFAKFKHPDWELPDDDHWEVCQGPVLMITHATDCAWVAAHNLLGEQTP